MSGFEKTAGPATSHILRRANLAWLIAYLVVLTGIVVGVFQLRRVTLASMDTPEARADWQAWRDAPPNQRGDLPVRRKPPSSEEPPSLVLMRDHFGVMLGAAIVFGSLLFAAIMFSARGALAGDEAGASSDTSGG